MYVLMEAATTEIIQGVTAQPSVDHVQMEEEKWNAWIICRFGAEAPEEHGVTHTLSHHPVPTT